MHSLLLLEDAKQEWQDAAEYYEFKQKGLGEKFHKKVLEGLFTIVKEPKHNRKTRKEYREYLINRFPFLIVYRIDEVIKTIVIVSVFHTKRNPIHKYNREK